MIAHNRARLQWNEEFETQKQSNLKLILTHFDKIMRYNDYKHFHYIGNVELIDNFPLFQSRSSLIMIMSS